MGICWTLIFLDMNMDSCIESKHKTGVGTVKDEKAPSEQNFSWGRYGHLLVCHNVCIIPSQERVLIRLLLLERMEGCSSGRC